MARPTRPIPGSIETHSRVQDFFFDDSRLLRRHDYQVNIAGGFPAASCPVAISPSWHTSGRVRRAHRRVHRQRLTMSRGRPAPQELHRLDGPVADMRHAS
jgi:hypothetical protein